MKHILKCDSCSGYTLKAECPKCGIKTSIPRPAKFSIEDKYGSYRRKAKIAQWKERGVL